MSKLRDLTDAELQAKIIEYNFKHESSDFAKFDTMLTCLRRERARRYWENYIRPRSGKSAAEVEARCLRIFHT